MLKTKKRIIILLSFILQFLSRPIKKHRDIIRRIVLKHRDDNKNSLVLDFGCGSGIFSPIFDKCGKISHVGVDNDIECLKFAKGVYGLNTYIAGDERLCFKRESFDFIIINNVLHHLKDDVMDRLFLEIEGVMKKNAFLIIIELKTHKEQRGFFFRMVTRFEKKFKGIRYISKDFLKKISSLNFKEISCDEISKNFMCYIFKRI